MILNDCGKIARDCWLETEQIRPNITLSEFIVMPNHFHAVFPIDHVHRRGVLHTPNNVLHAPNNVLHTPNNVLHTPLRFPTQTVGAVMRDCKSAVSKRVNQLCNMQGQRIWQRSFYDHIIRNHAAYDRISQYIIENPTRWQDDCFY